MNKVICDVCGTSYPENSPQCPICGFARSAETDAEYGSEQTSYTYVKGGRFSKSNVRKRNQSTQKHQEDVEVFQAKPAKKKEKSNTGLVIVIILLLLAIIAVVGYIAVRFFLPDNTFSDLIGGIGIPSASQTTEATEPQQETPTENMGIACQSIALDSQLIELEPNETNRIIISLTPADTTDVVEYSSDNEAVASVDATGMVLAHGEGTAVITVTCGNATAQCTVVCAPEPTETTAPATQEPAIVLNRKEITFDIEGQSWLIYDGPVALEDIIWTSDNNEVATILDGKVVAVGNGDTTVHGTYNGTTVSCVIHCKLDEEATTSSNISEAGSDSKKTYRLYNPTGYADDVTIRVGQKFTLKLVDENKKAVTDAKWEIENPKYCSYEDNTVKGLASGTTEITATYEGKTYTCIVRVIKK